ncbi:QcrA and Rieske domain-containing protein [Nitrospira sp. Nam74]
MKSHEEPKHTKVLGLDTALGSRRTFFQWATATAAGLIGFSFAIPFIGYLTFPALKRREKPWVAVGNVDDLPLGEPTQLDYMTTLHDGYLETKAHKAIWAIKQADGQITVFSPLCTHLGCGYHWDGEERKFRCPCHGSVYDVSGKVLAGPAPRQLDALPTKVENGQLQVIDKEFKVGIAAQVER